MKNLIIRCLIGFFLLLSACSKTDPVAWEVQREMKAYEDPIGDAQRVKFMLKTGDICVPGKVVLEKSYGYTEVVCPNRGVGWVADPYFKKFDVTHPQGIDIAPY